MLHRQFGEWNAGRGLAFLIVAGALMVGGCNPPEKGAIKIQGSKEEVTDKINNPFGTTPTQGPEDKLTGPKGQQFKSIKNKGGN